MSNEIIWTAQGPYLVVAHALILAIGAIIAGIGLGGILFLVRDYLPSPKRSTLAWITIGFIILLPIFIEDTSGYVFKDQNVLVDNLAGIGVLVGCKLLYSFYQRIQQGMICQE